MLFVRSLLRSLARSTVRSLGRSFVLSAVCSRGRSLVDWLARSGQPTPSLARSFGRSAVFPPRLFVRSLGRSFGRSLDERASGGSHVALRRRRASYFFIKIYLRTNERKKLSPENKKKQFYEKRNSPALNPRYPPGGKKPRPKCQDVLPASKSSLFRDKLFYGGLHPWPAIVVAISLFIFLITVGGAGVCQQNYLEDHRYRYN